MLCFFSLLIFKVRIFHIFTSFLVSTSFYLFSTIPTSSDDLSRSSLLVVLLLLFIRQAVRVQCGPGLRVREPLRHADLSVPMHVRGVEAQPTPEGTRR